jgi:hypothetical protein
VCVQKEERRKKESFGKNSKNSKSYSLKVEIRTTGYPDNIE